MRFASVGLAGALMLTGCGAEDNVETDAEPAAADLDDTTADDGSAGNGEAPVANACPTEGCQAEIVEVVADDDELTLTWKANFLPDVPRNHIHVFWDTYTADEVSADAEARGVSQGEWHVTDDHPTFTTQGGVSVANRGGSTVVCATAADRDHNVLDSSLVHCYDAADQLER